MLKQRTLTALALAPIAVALILLLPTTIMAAVAGGLFLLGAWEWARLAGYAEPSSRAILVVIQAAILVFLWPVSALPAAWYVIGAGIAWWLLALVWLGNFSWAAAPTRENGLIKLVAGELAIAPAWLAVVTIHGNADHGHWWLLFVLLLVWAADTFAYFAGRRYGKRKLAPRISPNKTTAGAWGALAGGALVALVGGWLLGARGFALALLFGLSLLTVLASIVGDLIESLLKRQANVKDSGTFMPGHGGLLDRMDSLLAALPVFAAGKALIDLAT
ncbi:phosphatidate cytidylyltransferase [Dokdonella sp.]|uniref:phosphatidate cytidylyltransferase n=1 Tax=Dokdonella sp. TaxID=2291710 RepID=UPI0031C3DF20|nr:phosphatidate cytidylyltransferase [Dokdonella sp.]